MCCTKLVFIEKMDQAPLNLSKIDRLKDQNKQIDSQLYMGDINQLINCINKITSILCWFKIWSCYFLSISCSHLIIIDAIAQWIVIIYSKYMYDLKELQS